MCVLKTRGECLHVTGRLSLLVYAIGEVGFEWKYCKVEGGSEKVEIGVGGELERGLLGWFPFSFDDKVPCTKSSRGQVPQFSSNLKSRHPPPPSLPCVIPIPMGENRSFQIEVHPPVPSSGRVFFTT